MSGSMQECDARRPHELLWTNWLEEYFLSFVSP